jgi:hypothetical protein
MVCSPVLSQQIMINSKGESVIMLTDGTWRIAGPADSTLIKQYVRKNQTIPEPGAAPVNASGRNETEEKAFLAKQWKEIYARISTEEKEVQNVFRAATNAQFKASSKLQNAQSNLKLMEPDQLATLQGAYDESVENLKKAKLQQKEIKSLVEKARKTNAKPKSLTASKINKFRTDFNLYLAAFKMGKSTQPNSPGIVAQTPPPLATKPENTNPFPSPSSVPPTSNTSPTPDSKSKNNKVPPVTSTAVVAAEVESYDRDMINKRPSAMQPSPYSSKPYVCVFSKDTMDSNTGHRLLELRQEVLFSHTDEDLRQYFKDTELITCKGHLTQVGPYTYLIIEFQIASSHAQPNFGGLDEGSLLRCKLMDGEYVSLYNQKANAGRIDPYSGYTVFVGQYILGKQEIKKLRKAELDKLRVMWNTGFEDYDVYQVDFFPHQIHCLDNSTTKDISKK